MQMPIYMFFEIPLFCFGYPILISYLSFCLIEALCCSIVMAGGLYRAVCFYWVVGFKRKWSPTR